MNLLLMASFLCTARSATLLVASRTDPASVVLANSLLQHNDVWEKLSIKDKDNNDKNDVLAKYNGNGKFYLWLQDKRLLDINHVNNVFESRCNLSPNAIGDVIFLSRHSAASGNPSLTVHPIGVPWLTDTSKVGGLAGRCSPPSPRIGDLYRNLIEAMKNSKLNEEFSVSLEATHHGPHVGK